jgi:hypothetical protein
MKIILTHFIGVDVILITIRVVEAMQKNQP